MQVEALICNIRTNRLTDMYVTEKLAEVCVKNRPELLHISLLPISSLMSKYSFNNYSFSIDL